MKFSRKPNRERNQKNKNTSAGARVGSENNTAVVSDADDGGAHGVRGI